MPKVQDIVREVRSKNAGPFWVTLEIFCDDDASYQIIKNSPNVTKEKVALLYRVNPEATKCFYCDSIFAVKFSFPRSKPSGHKYENDMHTGQQYIRLAELEI
jgi:hypothetical protein